MYGDLEYIPDPHFPVHSGYLIDPFSSAWAGADHGVIAMWAFGR
jgi:hypothetical protein